MKDVTIYTTMTCPYCYRAKSLLKKLSVPYKEIGVDFKPSLRADMAEKAGKTSVPQIWIDDKHILAFVKAINRTHLNAVCVLTHYTLVVDSVCHYNFINDSSLSSACANASSFFSAVTT